MHSFVQLRRLMDSNRDLARQIDALEQRYDEQFAAKLKALQATSATWNAFNDEFDSFADDHSTL